MEIKGCWWSKYKYRISKSEKQKFALSNRHPPITKRRKKIMYICELTSDNIAGIPKGLQEFKHLILSHEQISGLHKQTLNKKWTEAMGEESMEVNGPAKGDALDPKSKAAKTKTTEFMSPEKDGQPNKYIVKAFESTRGRGMAGVITSLSFDWGESTWEITPGRRAPQWLKVSIGFSPIHDIPLGIDYDGAMRAPAYNVGKAVEALGGDPYYADARANTRGAEQYYILEGQKINESQEPIEDKDKGEGGSSLGF
jgi:hypothetical protein